jgi:hypothetical protein
MSNHWFFLFIGVNKYNGKSLVFKTHLVLHLDIIIRMQGSSTILNYWNSKLVFILLLKPLLK